MYILVGIGIGLCCWVVEKRTNSKGVLMFADILSIFCLLIASVLFISRAGNFLYNTSHERSFLILIKKLPITFFQIKTLCGICLFLYCQNAVLSWSRYNSLHGKRTIHIILLDTVLAVLTIGLNNHIVAEHIYLLQQQELCLLATILLRYGISCFNVLLLVVGTVVPIVFTAMEMRRSKVFINRFQLKGTLIIESIAKSTFLIVLLYGPVKFYYVNYIENLYNWRAATNNSTLIVWLCMVLLISSFLAVLVIINYDRLSSVLFTIRNPSYRRELLQTKDVRNIFHSYKNTLIKIKLLAAKAKTADEDERNNILNDIISCSDTFSARTGDFCRIYNDIRNRNHVISANECTSSAIENTTIQNNISFNFSPDDQDVCFRGDKKLISEAVTNLLVNANDAVVSKAAENGEISVGVLVEFPWVAISVKDNGIGIPNAHKRRVFDALYTTKNSYNSWGIGLAFAKSVAVAHNGVIWMKSKENVGTEFQMAFRISHKNATQEGSEIDID